MNNVVILSTPERKVLEASVPGTETEYVTHEEFDRELAKKQNDLTVPAVLTEAQKTQARNNIGAVNAEAIQTAIAGLADVARSGSYTDIVDAPTKLSEFENDEDFATESFVNSSIATNTAYFRGTYNSVAELEAYSGEITNNDYAFVIVYDETVPTEVKQYDRYKYSDESERWSYEYTLNNSSFTAEQWSAINSQITAAKVAQIEANRQAILDKADKPNTIQYDSPTSLTLADNTEYQLVNVGELSVVYPSGNFDCWIHLITAVSGTVDIAFPSSRHIGQIPEFGNGEEWEISVKNGVYAAGKVETDE